MQVVVRNKHRAVVRRRRCASVHSGKHALRECGDITRALWILLGVSVLAFCQTVNRVLNLLHQLCLYIRIVLAQVSLGQSRHIMAECMAAEIGSSGPLPAAVAGICLRLKAGHLIELIQKLLRVQAEQVFLLFCKRIYQIVVCQRHVVHQACVGQIQRFLRKYRNRKLFCHGLAAHKYCGRLQRNLCIRIADFRSCDSAGFIHCCTCCHFPCDHRTGLAFRRKSDIAARLLRDIQRVQIVLCDLLFIDHTAVLCVEIHSFLCGCSIRKEFIMIQRRVQISAVVFWPVVADRLLHRLVASDHSGRPVIAVQAVRDLRRLSKAVPVDLRFFCTAVICDNNVRPLPNREKLGTAAAYFDIVRLFLLVGRTNGKCQRSRVVQG